MNVEERKSYLRDLESKIQGTERKIEQLEREKKDALDTDEMKELLRKKEELRVRWDELMLKVEQVRDGSEDAWRHLKDGLESAYQDLKRSTQSAIESIKGKV